MGQDPVCKVLRTLDLFESVDPDALEAFAKEAVEVELAEGDVLVEPGQRQENMHVLLEGRLEWAEPAGNGWTVMAVHEPVTYSGAVASLVAAPVVSVRSRALEPTRVWRFPTRSFRDMVRADELLLTKVAQLLYDVTTGNEATRQQRDRLTSLGTLAAGLAHEINNPAAAATRAIGELRRALGPSLTAPVERAAADSDPLAAADREDELGAFLEDRGVPSPWELAADLADAGLDVDWARETAPAGADGEALGATLQTAATGTRAGVLIGELDESLRRITQLVGAIREYSHVDRAPEADVDVHDGIEATLTILDHKFKKSSTTVVRDYDREIPRIAAFPSELNQVWTNLIVNALDAAAGGTITISTRCVPEGVEVEVADDGTGIPEGVLPHIFEPFYSTKDQGSSGQGLGLDIARRIVRVKHQGDLLVKSVPGDTRFVARLPKG